MSKIQPEMQNLSEQARVASREGYIAELNNLLALESRMPAADPGTQEAKINHQYPGYYRYKVLGSIFTALDFCLTRILKQKELLALRADYVTYIEESSRRIRAIGLDRLSLKNLEQAAGSGNTEVLRQLNELGDLENKEFDRIISNTQAALTGGEINFSPIGKHNVEDDHRVGHSFSEDF